jgi:hypothetical protein
MSDVPLYVCKDLSRIGLVPAPVKVLGHNAKLNYEIAGQVFRLNLSTLPVPQTEEGGFIIAHDDPGIRAADEVAAVLPPDASQFSSFHGTLSSNDIND